MSATTSVPDIQFTPTGLVLPAEQDILAGVQADMNAAFGGNLNPSLSTPQGQLSTSMTAIIGDKNSEIASIVNQVDPAKAEGRMQDAIGRIYFIDRKPGTPTTVTATCVGLSGTVIPVGAKAQDGSGNLYLCAQAGAIGAGGSVDLPFSCSANGPTACQTGTLTKIYQAIPGWDSINNAAPGVVGRNVESRAEFELRRQESVAKNGQSLVASIYGNLVDVDGVTDAYVNENPLPTAVTIGGYTLAPHSVYAAVVGGQASDIANAVWIKKSLGCNYNGNTTFTIKDETNYSYPYPEYTVKWVTPDPLPVKFAVQLANNPLLPSDIVAQVKSAIVAAFNGQDGGIRARTGATIFASRFYGGVSAIAPSVVSILSILIGSPTANATSMTVNIDRVPTIDPNDIAVTLV
jgi:hypothetical protein